MESLEVSGKTVEEALQKGLEKLGVSEEEVNFEVVRKGRSGFLGLGGEEAIVRITPWRPEVDEISEKAHQVVERLLGLMELEATVETKPAENREAALNIKGDDLGILIGRYGQTLERLQYIVKLILSRQYQAEIGISIDVDGYQEQRCRSLESLAQRIAQKVKTTVRAITLKPMSAKERRLVHLVIAKDPELTSQSIGRGEFRRVVISPRRKGTR